jgi:hypothetical protein
MCCVTEERHTRKTALLTFPSNRWHSGLHLPVAERGGSSSHPCSLRAYDDREKRCCVNVSLKQTMVCCAYVGVKERKRRENAGSEQLLPTWIKVKCHFNTECSMILQRKEKGDIQGPGGLQARPESGSWWDLFFVGQNPVYIRCNYCCIFGREITRHTVVYGVYIWFWPTLELILVSGKGACTHKHTHIHRVGQIRIRIIVRIIRYGIYAVFSSLPPPYPNSVFPYIRIYTAWHTHTRLLSTRRSTLVLGGEYNRTLVSTLLAQLALC